MALEDAATLGSLMRHANTSEQVPAVTALYEKLRISRTARLLDETAAQGVEFHLDDGEAQQKRDLAYSDSFQEETSWYYPRGQPWIWSYDAMQEAEKAFLASPY
jgi:salicylate hydroxylase